MTTVIGIVFIACVIISLILDDKKSSKEFYENRIKEIDRKKSYMQDEINSLKNKLNKKEDNLNNNENFVDSGYSSVSQYNEAVDEIENSIRYSPFDLIYYKTYLPDQLNNEESLRVQTKNHLSFITRRGISQKDIDSAKNIVASRERELGVTLNFKAFVQDAINQKGKMFTEEIYLGLLKIFEVSGGDVSKSDEVYIELFEDLPF